MRFLSYLSLTVIALAVVPPIVDCSELARGWGDDIKWVTLDKAREMSMKDNKPVMVIIHKTWCGACKSLKREVAKAKALATFSSNLVMVNLEDDEEPKDSSFTPDGGYVPRIFFLSAATQKVETSIINAQGNKEYKYFYYDTGHLLDSMKMAVDMATKKTEL